MLDSDRQKQEFQARVQRIQTRLLEEQSGKQRPATRLTHMSAAPKAALKPRRRIPLGGTLALVLGLAILLGANVTAFQAGNAPTGFFARALASAGPLPIAGAMLFVLMIGLGMRDKPHVIGLALGLPLMYFGEPYLAWLAPELWVKMYSADHVDTMLIQAGLRAPPVVPL